MFVYLLLLSFAWIERLLINFHGSALVTLCCAVLCPGSKVKCNIQRMHINWPMENATQWCTNKLKYTHQRSNPINDWFLVRLHDFYGSMCSLYVECKCFYVYVAVDHCLYFEIKCHSSAKNEIGQFFYLYTFKWISMNIWWDFWRVFYFINFFRIWKCEKMVMAAYFHKLLFLSSVRLKNVIWLK